MMPNYTNEQIQEMKQNAMLEYEQKIRMQSEREFELSIGNRATRRKHKKLARVKK